MQDEMAAHVAQAAERFRRNGMTEADAMFAARREFGNVTATQMDAREARGGQWIDGLRADVAYALRYFMRTPLATITMVITLGLGIGFSSAVFSTIAGVYTRPASGVPDDPSLVKIRGKTSESPFWRRMSLPEMRAFAERTETFAAIAGWTSASVVMDAGAEVRAPVTAGVQFTTPNFFTTLGIQPMAGRWFDQAAFDDLSATDPTVVLSETFATELYGDARNAIGRVVKVNGVDAAIIGVAGVGFNGAQQTREPRRMWMAIATMPQVQTTPVAALSNPASHQFDVFARLRTGVDAGTAEPVVRGVASRLNTEARTRAPRGDAQAVIFTADVIRLRGVIDPLRYAQERGPMVVIFSLLSIIVLLVCTTTVNSLLVGAAVARRYEFGVRLALGAARSRVVRQLLTEIGLISIAGGAIGMWVFGVLGKLTEISQDGFDVAPDWRTVGFTAAYALVTAAIAGLTPALHATRSGLAEIMKSSSTSGSTRSSRLQRAFVIAQIAIAQPLMIVLAAVMVTFFTEIPDLQNVEQRERLVIAEFDTYARYTANAPDQMPTLVRKLGEHPGVHTVMMLGGYQGMVVERPDAPDAEPRLVGLHAVPPDYFKTVGAAISSGREFVWSDTTQGVAIPVVLSRPVADSLFRGMNPVGQLLRRRLSDGERPVEMQVIGVAEIDAENTLDFLSDNAPIFGPFRRGSSGRVLIRTHGPPGPVIQAVHQLARAEARLAPLQKIGTLAAADRDRRSHKVGAFGAGAGMAAIVLAFASVGLYAMLAIAVGQRTREIGVRIALGADAREVVMLFFRNGVKVTLVGLAFGLPFGIAGLLAFNGDDQWLSRTAPIIASVACLLVIAVGALASWIPARRAAAVDPMVALRAE